MDSFSSRGKVNKKRKSTAYSSASKSKAEQRTVARMGDAAAERPARNLEHRYAGRKDKVTKPTLKAAARALSSARRDKYAAAVV